MPVRKLWKLGLGLLLVCAVMVSVSILWGDSGARGDAETAPSPAQSSPPAQPEVSPEVLHLTDLPKLDPNSWQLKLVNQDHPLDQSFTVTTAATQDGYLFDSRAVSALDAMLDAGKAAGMDLQLVSAYRSWDYQTMLFENKVQSIMRSEKLGRTAAEAEAATVVARPGASEHELGLAVDIASAAHPTLDVDYANTPEAQWLYAHCAQYGFILRYPSDKSAVTGIIFEPWHFRYVGVEAAAYVMDHGLCLEEFIAELTANGEG